VVVWSKAQADGVWLPVDDVLLAVEIISPGSEGVDTVTKRREYAAAGIPRATMPLAWVLNTAPAEHDLG
jgi:Uma2 family endonuclease